MTNPITAELEAVNTAICWALESEGIYVSDSLRKRLGLAALQAIPISEGVLEAMEAAGSQAPVGQTARASLQAAINHICGDQRG